MRKANHTSLGFTLVELVVVVAIILLVTGAGLAAFTMSRERRLVENETRSLSDILNRTQRRTLAGEKPTNCLLSKLEKYQVRITNGQTVEVWAICEGNDQMTESLTLTRAEITSPAAGATIDFMVVRGGVTPLTIELCGGDYNYEIVVSGAGSVSAPEHVGSC